MRVVIGRTPVEPVGVGADREGRKVRAVRKRECPTGKRCEIGRSEKGQETPQSRKFHLLGKALFRYLHLLTLDF